MDSSEETIEQDTTPENEPGEENSHPMDALLEDESYGMDSPRRGEIRTGTIARITDTDILVDIGYKSEGIIPGNELEKLPEGKREALTIGSEVTVYVLRTGSTILLSLSRAEEEKDWIDAQNLLKSKEVYEGVISGYNKGGLIVKLGGIRGFIPASQVSIARRWRSEGDSPDQRWGSMVGEAIAVKVIEVERRRNRLILSERAAAREAREVLKKRLISQLAPGEVRTGHVISLADFGAFVDIGGADGLVHTSEISWKRISHPREVLKVGQEVNVRVLSIDVDQNRISLSIRELLPDPWESIVEHFHEGQLVEGVITKLTKFGAFASLRGVSEFEVEGLVHISELSDRHIVHPREVVSENETLTLRIIRVDKERRRIGLSLKKVDSPEYAELDWQAAMKELNAEEEVAGEAAEVQAEPTSDTELAQMDEPAQEVIPEDKGEHEEEVEASAVEVAHPLESIDEETKTTEPPQGSEEVVEERELSDNLDVEEISTTDKPEAEQEGTVSKVVNETDAEGESEILLEAVEDEKGLESTEENELVEEGAGELLEDTSDELQVVEERGEIAEEEPDQEAEQPALTDKPDAPNEVEDGGKNGDGEVKSNGPE